MFSSEFGYKLNLFLTKTTSYPFPIVSLALASAHGDLNFSHFIIFSLFTPNSLTKSSSLSNPLQFSLQLKGPTTGGESFRHCGSAADFLHRHRNMSDSEKTNRLKPAYLEKVIPILMKEFSYKNVQEVPKIEKIVVNCGMGDAEPNSKGLEAAMRDLALITGLRPVKTKAKNSIAAFKLGEGVTVGIEVTLRGKVMYSFLDRLINLGFPRTRDFQGANPNSFDGHGNYNIGIRDQSVFPEIRYEALGKQNGMDVCITTTARADNEAQRLLALLGMPFREGGGGPTVLVPKKKKKALHFETKSRGRR